MIGDTAFGKTFHAIAEGAQCRTMQLLDTILPELMKCGLFPLRGKIPLLKSTRDMFRSIRELRKMAENAIEGARKSDEPHADGRQKRSKKKIFEILAR